jgi:hypothetical protein
MHIFYAPKEPRQGPMNMKGYENWDACKAWAQHAYNKIALTHIAGATRDLREKQQALAEIEIAEGKQTWWSRHPNFDLASAMRLLKRVYGVSLG